MQRARRVAGGGAHRAPRVEKAAQLPGFGRRPQIETLREPQRPRLLAGRHERQQHMGLPVGGPAARPLARARVRQQPRVLAARGQDVGPYVDQRLVHRVQHVGTLTDQAALHQPFRFREFVGPLGDGGGRADQERLGQRIGGLREQRPQPPHRLRGRDQPGRGRMPYDQRVTGRADQLRRVLGGVAQPPVHILPHRLVLLGQQHRGGLEGADQLRPVRQLVLHRAQYVHRGQGPAPPGQRRAQRDRRPHRVLRRPRQP